MHFIRFFFLFYIFQMFKCDKRQRFSHFVSLILSDFTFFFIFFLFFSVRFAAFSRNNIIDYIRLRTSGEYKNSLIGYSTIFLLFSSIPSIFVVRQSNRQINEWMISTSVYQIHWELYWEAEEKKFTVSPRRFLFNRLFAYT